MMCMNGSIIDARQSQGLNPSSSKESKASAVLFALRKVIKMGTSKACILFDAK